MPVAGVPADITGTGVRSVIPGGRVDDINIQGDQLNMAMCFRYLLKIDLSTLHAYSSEHWASHFSKVPEIHGHVYLVEL